MATTLPPGGISLYGAAGVKELQADSSSAILLRMSDSVLQDMKKTSQEKEKLHFVAGATPKLRIGGRVIDLTLSSDDFRNELFASTSPSDFTFTRILSHRAEIKAEKSRASDDTNGSDSALATLQSRLASLQQEKEAKSVNITTSFIAPPKNRYDAARQERLLHKNARSGMKSGSIPASPLIGATSSPHLGAAPTSAPTSEVELKLRAMKTPVIHLLAIEPLRREEIEDKTHIPRGDLEDILRRVGKQNEAGKWHLSDKAYRDLDVYKFEYPSEEQRKAAVNNAVRAYDRMRVEKDNQLWQLLLPKEERGKGKTLSRLHFGGGQVSRGLTPSYGHVPSPMPHTEGNNDSKAASVANTPKMAPSTPRPGSSTGDVKKRLLAKDPQKARAAGDAKEKKRKEREAAASDREGGKPAKKQAMKKANVKSEEIVRSSDDESDEEPIKSKTAQRVRSSPEKERARPAPKAKSKAVISASSDSSDTAFKDNASANPTAKPKSVPRPIDSPETKPKKPTTTGKVTPQAANNLSAPSSQQKTQRSPSNHGNRPGVPSPLGAARPRNASDVSDRSAVGVQKVRRGADTPTGLGITTAAANKLENAVKLESATSSKPNKKSDDLNLKEKPHKAIVNGSGTPKPLVNGVDHQTNGGVKRKAKDSPPQQEDSSMAKRRKQHSAGSQVNKAQPKQDSTPNGTDDVSPEGTLDIGSGNGTLDVDWALESITHDHGLTADQSYRKYFPAYNKEYKAQAEIEAKGERVNQDDRKKLLDLHRRLERMKQDSKVEVDSVLENITYNQGIMVAISFKKNYPAYEKEYNSQAEKEARGETVSKEDRSRLWDMHRRMERMKQEIWAASKREHEGT